MNTTPITSDQLLDERAAAIYLTVAVQTMRNWRARNEGGPRFLKVGARLVRYRLSDLDAFLNGSTESESS